MCTSYIRLGRRPSIAVVNIILFNLRLVREKTDESETSRVCTYICYRYCAVGNERTSVIRFRVQYPLSVPPVYMFNFQGNRDFPGDSVNTLVPALLTASVSESSSKTVRNGLSPSPPTINAGELTKKRAVYLPTVDGNRCDSRSEIKTELRLDRQTFKVLETSPRGGRKPQIEFEQSFA